MGKFSVNTLKRNVNALMKKHGTKQGELAQFLEMSQPNVSKALNTDDKKCFTLEQTFNIADYFNVSIDYLVGKRASRSAENNREIAELLASLIESGAVTFSEKEITEPVYLPETPYQAASYSEEKKEYPALLFREYWTPKRDNPDGDEDFELLSKGNSTNNDRINYFLKRMKKLYDLYINDDCDGKTYEALVQSYLDDVW